MGRKRHSKESIVQTLQNLAKRLNKGSLTKQDVQSAIPISSIKSYFGSLGNALEAAGLQRRSPTEHLADYRRCLSDDDLFRSILEAERALGHEPGCLEYQSNRLYSVRPFRRRFGKWSDVLAYYRKWKSGQGLEFADMTVQPNQDQRGKKIDNETPAEPRGVMPVRTGSTPSQLYGEPIDFRGLRHAPINEQGVVYVFAMVSRELGFNVEAIQQGFPDCEGKYLYDRKTNRWAKARIEFEYRASSFREHGHDVAQCDFIVCWVNDWPDCPVTVIELQSEIRKLPSR